ncbi:hypothetical protein CHLRE_09g408700v5 [Chlamydomonas reinhardtii]|uniref:WW domain-containing protein n=1 Tax=Chlamydomonas reinhardtii TaxID=3055 RepID=A0A2K3DFH5_CHLRE|nr:uncharacterized protein CHLRE_09g408700v5 [Chlamydomonas reinhardtii]PNW79272.1 hypothetical protein CHLRE_09g408700v5 [Chlamydomonas reinhardtii]
MLARTGMLCNRQSQLSLVASRCAFRGLSQGANPSGSEPGKLPAASQPDDDAPSTSAAASVGWLRGPEQNKPRKLVFDEWEEVRDPATGDVAWRSILTGEKTVPGVPQPDTWTEVVDKKTGLLYYWCRRTGETTAFGEPKPGPYGRKAQLDPEELEEATGQGVGARGGSGGGAGTARAGRESGGGPSLMRLVTNPLVLGVSALALAGIAYENIFK